VPTVIVLALAQILFFANVAMTVFGPGGKRAEPEAAPA
jgi:hypothetical protein